MAFEDLGPTFIKLAQILSTRGDLIGPEFAAELAKLQSAVPPRSFEEIEVVIDTELGVPHGEVFAALDPEPIGSASIGQVYRATLRTGEQVVVKVQRQDARPTIEMDLAILRRWIDRYLSRHDHTTMYDVAAFFEEFAFTLHNELDYTNEGANADRLRSIHHGDAAVFIPTIYWEHSTSRILVMDEIRGDDFGTVAHDPRLTPEDRHHLATVALHTASTQIFREGFFHADPHPGNFIVMEDLRIGLLDFGIVGTLSEPQRWHFLEFAHAIATRDPEGILDALWALGVTEPEAHRQGLGRDFDRLFHRIGDKSLEDLAAADLVGDLMRIAHRHQLRFPPDLALLLKVIAMLESAAVLVDKQFLLFPALEQEVRSLLTGRASATDVGRRIGRDARDLARFLEGLPHRADRLLQRLETGDLEVSTRHEDLALAAERVHRSLTALTLGMLIGVFLVAAVGYVIAAETAQPGSDRVGILRVLFIIGGLALASLTVWTWRARRK